MNAATVQPGPIRSRRVLCGVVPLLIVAAAAAGVSRADDERNGDEVSVVTVDGDVVAGRVQSLGETLTITTEAERTRRFEREDVVRIRRTGTAAPSGEPEALALLVNGDVVAGRPVDVGDDLLSVAWTGTQPPTTLQVPLEFVRAIVFAQPADRAERERLQRQWGLPRGGTDRLLLHNRTNVDGELSGLDGRNVLVSTGLGPVSTPRDQVAVLTLNSELASPLPLPQDASILLCEDGSRVTLTSVAIDAAGTLTGETAFGGEIAVPQESVTGLQLFSRRVHSLAALEPAEYIFTPFLSGEQPLVPDRNVFGGPLQLRGVRSATGLGMHSRSEVTWELGEEGWRSFAAIIGIDDAAGGDGDAVFRVALDGETIYESADVRGAAEPIVVGPLDVSGARRLTLSVDFGRGGNIRDMADWCDPLLMR